MMMSHSRSVSEVHYCWPSATQQEPPIEASLPSLDEEVSNHRSLEEWGNLMKKQGATLQIAFQNIRGFSKEEEMEVKLEALHCFVIDKAIDIFGFTESNMCWDVLPETQ